MVRSAIGMGIIIVFVFIVVFGVLSEIFGG
jgi:hypothetical protein